VDDCRVVTAWLGLNQGDDDSPWIFGTVTLRPGESLVGDEELFATTEAEAKSNHESVLARRKEARES
jgi:hypothetical protein